MSTWCDPRRKAPATVRGRYGCPHLWFLQILKAGVDNFALGWAGEPRRHEGIGLGELQIGFAGGRRKAPASEGGRYKCPQWRKPQS
jgi:hypothetical protein